VLDYSFARCDDYGGRVYFHINLKLVPLLIIFKDLVEFRLADHLLGIGCNVLRVDHAVNEFRPKPWDPNFDLNIV